LSYQNKGLSVDGVIIFDDQRSMLERKGANRKGEIANWILFCSAQDLRGTHTGLWVREILIGTTTLFKNGKQGRAEKNFSKRARTRIFALSFT